MIPYILHVTVITTICFLFYKLLLQKETFYRLNRWTLLGCLAVAFLLPLLPIPPAWSWRDKWNETVLAQDANAVQATDNKATSDPWTSAASGKPAEDIAPASSRTKPTTKPTENAITADQPVKSAARKATRRGKTSNAGTETQTTAALLLTATTPGKGSMVDHGITTGPGVADAGDKRSSNTAGTPAEKNGAGTLAQLFSGAALLLALQSLFYCYLVGLTLFGANFLLQLAVLLYQSYSRPVIQDGRFRIVEISGNRAPCSFGNTIFINPELYDWETYNQILIHEKIHVSGRHTLDILLAEIALVIQWFNPFAWLYRREVENNLEFLTDADVLLDASIERSAYQLSLLRVSAPHLPFSITNNYNQSLLKRRIVMMNTKRSALHTVWKYFFLIPLLTGLMCALNKPVIALGAATRKLSLAHAPFFDLLAPMTDTTKRPAGSADSSSPAGEGRGTSGAGTRSGSGDSAGAGSASGSTDGSSAGSADGSGNRTGSTTYIGSDRSENAPTTTLTYDVLAIQPAIAVSIAAPVVVDNMFRIDAYGETRQFVPKVKVDVRPLVATDVRADVKIVDLPRFAFVEDSLLTDGAWYVTSYGDHLSFDLKAGDEDHNWNYTMHVDKSEINPFPGQGTVEFKLVREAGTIVFKGQFDGEEGFGHFHFTPDPGYIPALKQLGVEDMEDRRQFGFFALNIKKDYVAMLTRNGYPHISERDLFSLAAMHVDEAYIKYWQGTDLGDGDGHDPRMLIRLKALHIDRTYVDELKAAGYDHLTLRELESLKAQHIDKDYIRSLGRGTDNQPIPVRELVSYKALHIDSAYLQDLRKLGYYNLATRDITSLYSMHVTPEYIRQLQALGYKDLSARELCSLMAMHVTPEYIKGFTDLGYTDLNARDLSSLKAMNITPDFVVGFNKLGFDHIPVRTLTSLKATGVTPEYVAKMKAQGFDSKDLSKYIRLKTDFN